MKFASRNCFDVAKTLVYVFSIKESLISCSICTQIAQRGYFYPLWETLAVDNILNHQFIVQGYKTPGTEKSDIQKMYILNSSCALF